MKKPKTIIDGFKTALEAEFANSFIQKCKGDFSWDRYSVNHTSFLKTIIPSVGHEVISSLQRVQALPQQIKVIDPSSYLLSTDNVSPLVILTGKQRKLVKTVIFHRLKTVTVPSGESLFSQSSINRVVNAVLTQVFFQAPTNLQATTTAAVVAAAKSTSLLASSRSSLVPVPPSTRRTPGMSRGSRASLAAERVRDKERKMQEKIKQIYGSSARVSFHKVSAKKKGRSLGDSNPSKSEVSDLGETEHVDSDSQVDQVEELVKLKIDLEHKVEVLSGQLQTSSTAHSKQKEQIISLQRMVSDLEHQLKESEDKNSQAEHRLKNLEKQAAGGSGELIMELEAEIRRLRMKLFSTESTRETSTQTRISNQFLEEEERKLKLELSEAHKTIAAYRRDLDLLRVEMLKEAEAKDEAGIGSLLYRSQSIAKNTAPIPDVDDHSAVNGSAMIVDSVPSPLSSSHTHSVALSARESKGISTDTAESDLPTDPAFYTHSSPHSPLQSPRGQTGKSKGSKKMYTVEQKKMMQYVSQTEKRCVELEKTVIELRETIQKKTMNELKLEYMLERAKQKESTINNAQEAFSSRLDELETQEHTLAERRGQVTEVEEGVAAVVAAQTQLVQQNNERQKVLEDYAMRLSDEEGRLAVIRDELERERLIIKDLRESLRDEIKQEVRREYRQEIDHVRLEEDAEVRKMGMVAQLEQQLEEEKEKVRNERMELWRLRETMEKRDLDLEDRERQVRAYERSMEEKNKELRIREEERVKQLAVWQEEEVARHNKELEEKIALEKQRKQEEIDRLEQEKELD
ncbi:hypothetical protein ADUPG1_011720, partial [Aduncisulcus paluster]